VRRERSHERFHGRFVRSQSRMRTLRGPLFAVIMPPELFNESYRAYDARVLFLFAQRPHYRPHDHLDRARVARDDGVMTGKRGGEGGELALGNSELEQSRECPRRVSNARANNNFNESQMPNAAVVH